MLALHQRQLLDLLSRHAPLDAAEQAHFDAIHRLVSQEPHCFDRRTWRPGHITGSAFVVDPAHRVMLLHHHRKLDRWLQLGGHDDGARDAAATALREAREESGLRRIDWPSGPRSILDLDVHVIPARGDEPAHQHLDVRFMLLADSKEPLHRDARESKALAWVALDAVDAKMNEVGARRVLAKLEVLLGG